MLKWIFVHRKVSYTEPVTISYMDYDYEEECCSGYTGLYCDGMWYLMLSIYRSWVIKVLKQIKCHVAVIKWYTNM